MAPLFANALTTNMMRKAMYFQSALPMVILNSPLSRINSALDYKEKGYGNAGQVRRSFCRMVIFPDRGRSGGLWAAFAAGLSA